ncbi:MAG TPA: hypothetical protein VFD91_11210 [Mariniphaga sp.]|nr:hypothetical protein [Mariniphaga sp.]
MSSNNLYTIFETDDPTDPFLSIIRDKLQESNIDYFEDGNEPRSRPSGAAYFEIKIKVDANAAESANEIVSKAKFNKATFEIPSFCPKCDNNNIIERQSFSFLPWMPNKKFKCMDCGHEWKKDNL